MRRALYVMIAYIFLCTGTPVTWGGAEEITVGISTGYPPYYYKQNGVFTGICIDLINSVAQTLGVNVIYKEYPWMRLLANAKQGRVDAIMPLFRTKEREQFLYFDNLSIAQETNFFFTWKGKEIFYDGDFNNLRSFRIGVVSDYSYGKAFDQFDHFNKVVTLNDKHLLEMFKRNRFDLGVGNRDVTLFYARNENLSHNIKFLVPYISSDLLYIGFSKKKDRGDLAKKFASALENFKITEDYKVLMKKYIVSD